MELSAAEEVGAVRKGGPLLVAFEGVDGAGKSVACARVAELLKQRGEDCIVLQEPGGTRVGNKIRSLLLHQEGLARDPLLEALLFSASRRQLVLERIVPELAAGRHVLLDRSFLSTWVYQGLAAAPGTGLPLARLEEWTRAVHEGCWPDAIFLLDLPDAEARQRRGARSLGDGSAVDAMEARGEAFLSRVASGFRQLAEQRPELVRRIDARPEIEVVASRCLAAFDELQSGGPG
ncbi:MAG: dTMP kinase [Planctomycetota bacterium]|nr:MAG: dTMP kinase [Planctomycetota bacterium]